MTAPGPVRRALQAQPTKLRTLPSSTAATLGIVGLTVGLSAFMAAVGHTDATRLGQGDDDVVVNSLRGVHLGQVAVIAFAVATVTAEHATGLARATFTALPRRRV